MTEFAGQPEETLPEKNPLDPDEDMQDDEDEGIPEESDPCYRDGSVKNECWREDKA